MKDDLFKSWLRQIAKIACLPSSYELSWDADAFLRKAKKKHWIKWKELRKWVEEDVGYMGNTAKGQ